MKKINVSKDVAKWYIDEMDLNNGDYIQIFVKLYGGIPTIFPSFFLGVSPEKDGNMAIKEEVEGITFYINKEDTWLLDEHNLKVELNGEEPEFIFEER